MNAIELNNFSHSYQLEDNRILNVLKEINVKFEVGKIITILGPSGSGKSTLLELLSLRINPSFGEIFVQGKDVRKITKKELSEIKKDRISYVFQQLSRNFISRFTYCQLKEHLKSLFLFKIDPNSLKTYEKLLNINDKLSNVPIRVLSGGEQQKISLLISICKNTDIILFDEPTSYLDFTSKENVIKLIKLLKKDNRLILIATHDLRLIEISDRLYFLSNGSLKLDFSISNLLGDNYLIKIHAKVKKAEKKIEIPDLIYNQLDFNALYVFSENKSVGGFSILKVNEELFHNSDKNNWFFLTKKEIDLPKSINDVDLNDKKLYWLIGSSGLILQIEDTASK